MFSRWLIVLLISWSILPGSAQQGVRISAVPVTPVSSAILQIQSGTKGVLLPRTTIASIGDPVDGLMIYDTIAHSFMVFDQDEWVSLLKSSDFNFFYADRDEDGYGDPYAAIFSMQPPAGYVILAGDCDDSDPAVNPEAFEDCDDRDNNCDGLIDNSTDADQDGYSMCVDCDDNNPDIHPGAMDICNGIDDDCDIAIDEGCVDISWCNLQFPSTINMPNPGTSPPIYGQVYAAGVTDQPGQGAGIIAEVGIGTPGSDPWGDTWNWYPASFNVDMGNNDEYVGAVVVFTPGTYLYAYRYSADGGFSWIYGDLDGSPYSSDQAGILMSM